MPWRTSGRRTCGPGHPRADSVDAVTLCCLVRDILTKSRGCGEGLLRGIARGVSSRRHSPKLIRRLGAEVNDSFYRRARRSGEIHFRKTNLLISWPSCKSAQACRIPEVASLPEGRRRPTVEARPTTGRCANKISQSVFRGPEKTFNRTVGASRYGAASRSADMIGECQLGWRALPGRCSPTTSPSSCGARTCARRARARGAAHHWPLCNGEVVPRAAGAGDDDRVLAPRAPAAWPCSPIAALVVATFRTCRRRSSGAAGAVLSGVLI